MESEFTIYKLMVLFMLKHSGTELTNSQLSEYILENERANYFRLQQSISELIEADLISQKTVSNSTYYKITKDGETTLSYFEDELSKDMREEIIIYLGSSGFLKPTHQIITPANYYQLDNGGYAVRCRVLDKKTSLLDLTFVAPSHDAAKVICENWPLKWEKIYEKIMDGLL